MFNNTYNTISPKFSHSLPGVIERGKATLLLVIAHRLSTIKNSHAIMVLEQGEIIERGNHDSLLEEKGRYYQLYTGKAQLD